MRIVINHLTRMQAPHICVAGIDRGTNRHVRPVLRQPRQLTAASLAREGGPFDIGVEVDLGPTRPAPAPPETEDHLFNAGKARLVRRLPGSEFWSLINLAARRKLHDVFGSELHRIGRNSCGIDEKCGSVSLGCLIPARCPRIRIRERAGKPAQVRMSLTDGVFYLDLSVTDVRLFMPDLATPDDQAVADLDRRLRRKVGVVLSVGLTRPFASSPEFPPVHWLQVNNVHLEDAPTWPIGG